MFPLKLNYFIPLNYFMVTGLKREQKLHYMNEEHACFYYCGYMQVTSKTTRASDVVRSNQPCVHIISRQNTQTLLLSVKCSLHGEEQLRVQLFKCRCSNRQLGPAPAPLYSLHCSSAPPEHLHNSPLSNSLCPLTTVFNNFY